MHVTCMQNFYAKDCNPCTKIRLKFQQEWHSNLLEGVVGQAGNIQRTCSRNPAPIRILLKQRVCFFLKEQREKTELFTGEGLSHGGCHNREGIEKKVGGPMQSSGKYQK